MIELESMHVGTNLSMFPYVVNENDRYRKLVLSIACLQDDINAIDQDILIIQNSYDKLLVGLAFLNNVFLRYNSNNFDPTIFIAWYSQKSDLLYNRLGPEFCELIKYFIHNFPQDSLLYLTPTTQSQEFLEIQIITFIATITISYSSSINPLSSMFFHENGRIIKNLPLHLLSVYCIGTEPLKIHDYLKFVFQNFNTLKSTTFRSNYSKGGSYTCSSDCDYLYIVNNCGGVTEFRDCPFCGKQIGGTGHKHIQREGHNNLNDGDALRYLQQKTEAYDERDSKGFIIGKSLPITNVRLMKQKSSFHISSLLTSSALYFLQISELLDPEVRDALINNRKEFENSLIGNFREISTTFPTEEPYVWILNIISQIPRLLESFHEKPIHKEIRNQFELIIENEIIIKNTQVESINSYKQLVNSYLKPSDVIEYIEELKIPSEEYYKNMKFFRIIEYPSFLSMTRAFNSSNRKGDLNVLNIIIESYTEIENLVFFHPILSFSNALIDHFSFNISRQEASKRPLSEAITQESGLIHLYKEFKKAWRKLTIPLINDCHLFKKVSLEDEDMLSFFLIDDDINGDGKYITAALKSLGNLQNRILSAIKEQDEKSKLLYPIQGLKKEDIIVFSNEKSDLITQCSINSLEYGIGREVIYDYDRIQNNLLSDLRNKKFIDTANLNYVQYQFELLNTRGKYSGIISDIRNKIPQENLPDQELLVVDKLIRGLEKRNTGKNPLTELYSTLDKIICTIKNSKPNQEDYIGSFIKNTAIKVNESFRDCAALENIKLKNIVSLYEFIELKCYSVIINHLDEEYHIDIQHPDAIKAQFETIFNRVVSRNGAKINVEIHNVIKRMIIRLLSAKINPDFLIIDYLLNESLWNQEFLYLIEDVLEKFPKDLKLSEAICLETIINSINSEEEPKIKQNSQTKISKKKKTTKSSSKKIKY